MNMQQKNELRGSARLPRIGFLGVGWIGLDRMKAIIGTDAIQAVAVSDPSPERVKAALELAPSLEIASSFDGMLNCDLDGIVIATPSAMHAEQSIQALERGIAVFCQKPLGRTAAEVKRVVEAARRADRLLGVDLSYRFTAGMRHIHDMIASGKLGKIFAADLVFHNAYGPDKPWFYDKALSGGGCVIDLGVHLVDMALWALDFPDIKNVHSSLFAESEPLPEHSLKVEDYAIATIELCGGTVVRLACSWRLHAGRDAVIGATFHGTKGGAEMYNIEGSFYDFVTGHFAGTVRHRLASPPDAWGGRAAADWARRLADGSGFEPESEKLIDVAQVLDRIYGRL
jgi:predicted dehydrogenase